MTTHGDAVLQLRQRPDILNGHGDELLYERGAITTNLPLAELKRRCHINDRARAAGQAADFSQRIRQGVPGTEPGI